MPPHIFLLVAVGASLVAGYRLAHNFNKKRAKQDDIAKDDVKAPRDLGALKQDEATGEYRPSAE